MTILEAVDRYNYLIEIKSELADATKQNNMAIETARRDLAAMMIEEEVSKITRSGYAFSLRDVTRYSKKGGVDDELFKQLRADGLGGLIHETVNANSLHGAMSSLADEHDGALPEAYSNLINIYQGYDIGRRKDK